MVHLNKLDAMEGTMNRTCGLCKRIRMCRFREKDGKTYTVYYCAPCIKILENEV